MTGGRVSGWEGRSAGKSICLVREITSKTRRIVIQNFFNTGEERLEAVKFYRGEFLSHDAISELDFAIVSQPDRRWREPQRSTGHRDCPRWVNVLPVMRNMKIFWSGVDGINGKAWGRRGISPPCL